MGKNDTVTIDGYEVVTNNYKCGEEGLLVASRIGTFCRMEKVSKRRKNMLSAKIEYPDITLRVIVCHGPQEDEESDSRVSFFDDLAVEVERCTASDEIPVVLGDFNAKVKRIGEKIVPYSANGKLMQELLLENCDLTVANFSEVTVGKWTRIQDTKKGTQRSVLDYCLLDGQLLPHLTEFTIDEEKISTPYRMTTCQGSKKITHTDHCMLMLKLDCHKGVCRPKTTKIKVWNFTPAGYVKYHEASEESISIDNTSTSDDAYEQWMKSLLILLHNCFGKRTIRIGEKHSQPVGKARKNVRKILQTEAKKGKIQRALVKKYVEFLRSLEEEKLEKRRATKLKETAALLTEEDRFSSEGYWKLKKSVSKKPPLKITSVLCSDKLEVTGENLIKEEFRKEFEYRLRNRQPHTEWEQYTKNINEALEIILELSRTLEDTPEFSIEELKKALKKLKEGKSPGHDGLPPEVLINAGNGVCEALLSVLNIVKRTRVIPEQWNWVKITPIYKNRGSRKELVNYRGIFLTLIVTKVFEHLLKERMTVYLVKVNLHQAGARPKRSPCDNLFLLYACIDHYKYKGKALYINAYDFEQAFDSLWLQDCIMSMKQLGIPSDILHLVYNLNKKAKIVVKTPFGLTNESLIEDIVEQGTVLGPNLCSVSTAEYCETNTGVAVGRAIVSSLLFVDDIIDLNGNANGAATSHENTIIFGRRKKLGYSRKKCKSMVINGKKSDELPSLYIDGVEVSMATVITYLGDLINNKGTNSDLIADRCQRGISAMRRIEALVKETGLGVHQINVHLLLYHCLFLSCILFNSQVWRGITEKEMRTLEKLQARCLRKIVNAPACTATSFVYLEFGVEPIRYIIQRNNLMFLHHIVHLDEDDPVKFMWENMKVLEEETNWWSSVKVLMKKYDIKLKEVEESSRESFKKLVKEKLQKVAHMELSAECKSKKKTSALIFPALEAQDYLNHLYPAQARIVFQCRSKTLDIKDHRSYKYKDTVCRKCGVEEETVQHITNCGQSDIIDTSIIYELGLVTYDTKVRLAVIAKRIQNFLEEVR